MLNKVLEVTIIFWITKIFPTTVGETAADFMSTTLHFGLTGSSVVMTVVLILVLVQQIRAQRYIPALYWLTVVLVRIVGTLITDNLSASLSAALW